MNRPTQSTVRSMQKARSPPSQKKRTRRKKNRNGNPKGSAAKPTFHLSPCAKSFAHARLDPFGYYGGEPPCVPDFYDRPSYKFATTNRGTCAIGTAGIGFVTIGPQVFSNDLTYAVNTGSAYTQSIIDFAGGSPGVARAPDTKYPFPSTAPRGARCVAAGLRIRYTGTQLNLGGMTIAHSNNGSYIYQGKTVNDLTSLPEAVVHPCTRRWVGVTWNPTLSGAYDYSYNGIGEVTTASTNAALMLLVTGTAGNTYEFEMIRYFEAVDNSNATGNYPVPSTSKSHSDPVGFGYVKDFLASQTASDIGASLFSRFEATLRRGAVAAATSYFGPSVLRIEY